MKKTNQKQTERIAIRITKDLRKKIESSGKNLSIVIKTILEEYFYEKRNDQMKKN